MKITYNLEEIADIVRAQAEKDLTNSKKKLTAGEIITEYVDLNGSTELESMTVEMED